MTSCAQLRVFYSRLEFFGHEESLVLEGGDSQLDSEFGIVEVVGRDPHGPEGEAASAHDQDLADTVVAALLQDLLDALVRLQHRVHGEESARRQHGGHGERHGVWDLHQVLEIMDDNEFGIAGIVNVGLVTR